MNTITLPSNILAAATYFEAKNDVRTYLNGIHITSKKVYGTDGHRCVSMDHGQNFKRFKGKTIQFTHKLPARAKTTTLYFKLGVAIHFDCLNRKIGATAFDVNFVSETVKSEGKDKPNFSRYPDIDARIFSSKGKLERSAKATLNITYISSLASAFKGRFLGLTPYSFADKEHLIIYKLSNKAISKEYGNPKIGIMGMRIDEE